MEDARLKFNTEHYKRILIHPVVVAVFLALLCLGLHHSVLSGGWRYDDGTHLYFAALYSPWQYFFLPEIMREQSWANFTPWNALFYEMGLPFFSLAPAGYYAHMLLLLWLTAVATYVLLRLWLNAFPALMGAALFLAMPATGAIGQMLMTGHYLYGLLFTILTFYFFTRGIRENNLYLSVLAAFFYLLACWSKELYVPAILALVLLPEGHWKTRLWHCWPVIIMACIYTVYRLMVLQGVGGYGLSSLAGTTTVTEILAGFISSLFGSGWTGVLIAGYLLISVILLIVTRRRQFNPVFLLGCLVVVMLPVIPVLQQGFNDAGLRFLLFVGWSLSILLAWISRLNRIHTGVSICVLLALIFSQQRTIQQLIADTGFMEEQSRFLIESENNAKKVLYPFHHFEPSYLRPPWFDPLTYLSKAITLLEQRDPPHLISNHEELLRFGDNPEYEIYHFSEDCRCVRPMYTEEYRAYADDFRARLAAGADEILGVSLQVIGEGFRKRLRWEFTGHGGNFNLYIRKFGVMSLPPSGELMFGVTGLLKENLHVYVHLNSEEGWIARSPLFTIDPGTNGHITWQGKSAVNW